MVPGVLSPYPYLCIWVNANGPSKLLSAKDCARTQLSGNRTCDYLHTNSVWLPSDLKAAPRTGPRWSRGCYKMQPQDISEMECKSGLGSANTG